MSAERHLELSLDRDACYKPGWQLSLSAVDGAGYGHGYRLFGPHFAGCQHQQHVLTHVLTERDAREIRRYLDEVFPLAADDATEGK